MLEVIKQELPVLEIKDYDKIKLLVEQDVKKYQNYIVTEDTLADDIKLRAEINNKAKAINTKRLEIEKIVSSPIKTFKSKCDDLISLYEEASQLIDKQIKDFEREADRKKGEMITILFNNNILELKDLISLDMIFDEKWLNKGMELDKVEKDMVSKLNKIRTDLKVIKELNSKHILSLNSNYLRTFDLGQVIIENQRLNELEAQTASYEVKTDEIKQEVEKEKQATIEDMITNKVEVVDEDIKEYTLWIKGAFTKIEALRKFLDINEIEFKLEKEVSNINKVILIGRITKDIELKYTETQKAVATFTVAIDRNDKQTDFINCVVWNEQAENLKKYQSKGSKIAIDGNIQTRTYEKDGKKTYITEVLANRIEYLDSKAKETTDQFKQFNNEHPDLQITDEDIDKTFNREETMDLPF